MCPHAFNQNRCVDMFRLRCHNHYDMYMCVKCVRDYEIPALLSHIARNITMYIMPCMSEAFVAHTGDRMPSTVCDTVLEMLIDAYRTEWYENTQNHVAETVAAQRLGAPRVGEHIAHTAAPRGPPIISTYQRN